MSRSTNVGPLEAERAHVGIDVGRDLIDRDEQRELTGPQRVEDLAVVVARPDVAAVGDQPQAREVVTGVAHRGERDTDARRRQARVEHRAHDPQRDEIAKSVTRRRRRRLRRDPERDQCRSCATVQSESASRLRGGETHRPRFRNRRGGSGRATAGRDRRTCPADHPGRGGRR